MNLIESDDPIAVTMFDENKHVFRAVEESSQFFDELSATSELHYLVQVLMQSSYSLPRALFQFLTWVTTWLA